MLQSLWYNDDIHRGYHQLVFSTAQLVTLEAVHHEYALSDYGYQYSDDLSVSHSFEVLALSWRCLLALIVYRIYGVQKSLKQGFAIVPNPRLTRLLFTLIESGLLYNFSVIVLFILYIGSNNGQYGVSNAVCLKPLLPLLSSDPDWAVFRTRPDCSIDCTDYCE